jgi:hypothetical protein
MNHKIDGDLHVATDRKEDVGIPENIARGGTREAATAELTALRHRVAVQAAELGTLRWHINALLNQQRILSYATGAKGFLKRWFPGYVEKAKQAKRDVASFFSSAKRRRAMAAVDVGDIDIASGLRLRTPVLLADGGSVGRRIAAEIGSRHLIKVAPGAGWTRTLPVAPEGEPTLRLPSGGSLVDWMVTDSRYLRHVGAIVVDANDDVSLGLVRGRLSAGQQLVLTHSEPAKSVVAAELGAPEFQGPDLSLYTRFPNSWLDPVGDSGKPVPEVVGARKWPKISVVMVSFNQAAFLEEGLRSILDQGYPDLEFLVVDGMSTDGSIDILERYRDQLSFLLIEKDKGQSDGLNKGFARATGDIVTWVNSDDLLEPGALFRVAQAFSAHQVDMVVGGCRQIGLTRDKVIRNHHTKLPYGLPIALPLGLLLELDHFWWTASFFYQPEVFFSRDIWNRSGGRLRVDLYYVLDYDLWVRMAAAGATIVHIPEFLACSRTHDQQKTVEGMPYLPEVQRLLGEYASRLASPSA